MIVLMAKIFALITAVILVISFLSTVYCFFAFGFSHRKGALHRTVLYDAKSFREIQVFSIEADSVLHRICDEWNCRNSTFKHLRQLEKMRAQSSVIAASSMFMMART